MYEYQPPWTFEFLINSDIHGAFSLMETGRFVEISVLEGLPNCSSSCWTNGDLIILLEIIPEFQMRYLAR